MKIVCVCAAGNVRSVGLARVLKGDVGGRHDAVAIGHQTAGEELKSLLFNWADRIVVMTEGIRSHVPAEHAHKLLVCEVGPDVYGDPRNPELRKQCKAFVAKAGLSR